MCIGVTLLTSGKHGMKESKRRWTILYRGSRDCMRIAIRFHSFIPREPQVSIRARVTIVALVMATGDNMLAMVGACKLRLCRLRRSLEDYAKAT